MTLIHSFEYLNNENVCLPGNALASAPSAFRFHNFTDTVTFTRQKNITNQVIIKQYAIDLSEIKSEIVLNRTLLIFCVFVCFDFIIKMTSMFDQYNTALKREEGPSSQLVSATLPSSGFVSVRTTEETPIFSKRKMPINLPQDILFTRVCNNWLVVLMSHNVLLRLYLQQTDRQDGKFQLHFVTIIVSE